MMLVMGFGNPTRGDDGAGWEVARRLGLREIPAVETRVSQQLNVELIEEWGAYEKVLFIDADPQADRVRVERVVPQPKASASTHHLAPEALLQLSKSLKNVSPPLYLCRVPASHFNFSESFSPETRRALDEAVAASLDWIHQLPLGGRS